MIWQKNSDISLLFIEMKKKNRNEFARNEEDELKNTKEKIFHHFFKIYVLKLP